MKAKFFNRKVCLTGAENILNKVDKPIGKNEGESMMIYFLMALISLQLFKRLRNEPVSFNGVMLYLIPYWKEGDGEDRILGILQLFIVACISVLKAMKTVGLGGQILVFFFTFLSFIWMIKILIITVEWVQDYFHTMTINILFTVMVPVMIILNLNHLMDDLEVKVCFIALFMSIMIVYTELIGIVLGIGNSKHITQKMMKNNSLKLKSIFTWFFIILGNLYTLILFIQFYMDKKAHHFIQAETFTKESAVDLFYYLIVTFTTVGFGDISPNTLLAKLITALIAMSGMLFTGIFVGSILNLEE